MAEQIKFGDKLFLKGETVILDNDANDSILKSKNGTLKIEGNLTVSGTTTTVDSETVTIADNILLLNSNVTGTPSENGGIEIERGTASNKSLIWNETDDKWTVGSETFVASMFEGNLTGNVTGDLTGNVTSSGLSTFSDIDINGGNIDGTVIGASVPQAGTFTTLSGTLDYSNLINVPANFTELVEDTTPQLGGNLDLNTFDLTTTDNFATLTTSKSSGNTSTVVASTETNLSNTTVTVNTQADVANAVSSYITLSSTEITNLGFKGEVSLTYFGAAATSSNFVWRDVSDSAEQNNMVIVYSSSLDEYTFTLPTDATFPINSLDADIYFKQYAYGEMTITSSTALTTSNTQFKDSNGFDIDTDNVTITNTGGTNYKIVFWTHDVSAGDVITVIHPSEENTIFGWGGITTTDGRLTLLDSSGDLIYKLPATDGTANQVLTTDGSGDLSWITSSAGFDGAFSSLTGKPTTLAGYGITDGGSSYSDSDVATYLGGNLNTHILPDTNDTYDIGSASFKIRDLYVSDNSIHIGDNTLRTSGGNLLLNDEIIGGGSGTDTVENFTNVSTPVNSVTLTTNMSEYTTGVITVGNGVDASYILSTDDYTYSDNVITFNTPIADGQVTVTANITTTGAFSTNQGDQFTINGTTITANYASYTSIDITSPATRTSALTTGNTVIIDGVTKTVADITVVGTAYTGTTTSSEYLMINGTQVEFVSGSTLTDIVNNINSAFAPNILVASETSNIITIITSSPTLVMTGSFLNDLGLSATGSTSEYKIDNLATDLNTITNITASILGSGQLRIQSSGSQMIISGTALNELGITAGTWSANDLPTVDSIVSQINAMSITGVTAAVVTGTIKLTSSTTSITITEVTSGAMSRLGFSSTSMTSFGGLVDQDGQVDIEVDLLTTNVPFVTLSTLKSVVAASTDFADFQSRIAAL